MDRTLLRLDLNLLKALHVLLQERNVTRAADRLFITQSAMSKTLHRLRESLNDPLLVRTSSGLVPTPRGERLEGELKIAFSHLESAMAPTHFSPATATGTLRIATPETFALGVVPGLVARLNAVAPRLQVEVLHLDDDHLQNLASGTLDFIVYLDQPYADGFITHRLFSAAPVIWCRAGHPIVEKAPISLEDICAWPRIVFHSPTIKVEQMQEVRQALQSAGLPNNVMFETSHLLVALVMLGQTEALMQGPNYMFRFPMFRQDLVALPIDHIPLVDHLRSDIALVQHERTANSALHQWIAAEAVNTFASDAAGGSLLDTAETEPQTRQA